LIIGQINYLIKIFRIINIIVSNTTQSL